MFSCFKIVKNYNNLRCTFFQRNNPTILSVCWIGASVCIAYVSDFVNVISLQNDQVCRPIFFVGATLLGINLALTIYLVLYLPRVLRIDHTGWSTYCPRIIPTMTGIGIASFLLITRATWPVWGVFTPLILAVVALGALFSLHFIPWCV